MNMTQTDLPEVWVLEPTVFHDPRGFFMESYNQNVFQKLLDMDVTFVQDNHSSSTQGVMRGLHYQLPPKAQGKLVRVLAGCVFDVVVDIRKNSPRFGQWVGVELSRDNHKQLWIPPGFAHGFIVLSECADVLYKTTEYYCPELERVLDWYDKDVGIVFPSRIEGVSRVLSGKDKIQAKTLCQAEVFL